MIARTWRGTTRAADADAYVRYLEATGVAAYRRTPGNRGVLLLRRVRDGRADFLLVSLWDSEDAVRAFAGDDPERAVFYPEDDRYLIARDESVDHYDLIGPPPSGL
jgi:heme-degrading monooxygenase HmoA